MYHVNRLIKGKGTNITLKDTAKYPFQKFDIFGKTEQKRVEGIEGKRITAEYITANDIQSENGRITIEGNTYQDLEPLLPEEYIQLDYIEGTGSQYINLGYGLGTNSKIELSIDIDRSVIDGKGYALFGARSSMDDGYAIWANISDNNKMRWDVKTSKTGNGALVNGNNIVIKDGFDNYLNGIKVSANTTVDDFEPKYDSYLLSINTAKTAERALPAKIKYFKAWVDGNLEWDCLPAKRVSDGAIGLYDLVYGDFLVSATSVAFAAGNEVTIPNFDNQREVKAVGDNIQLFNKNDESITYNYRLGSDGALFGQDNVARQSFVSGYISIDELNDYIVNYSVTDYSKRICFYDENKKFISANTSSSVFKTPEASKYLRLCNLISEKENIKLEKGTKSTPWSEFGQGNTTIVKRNKNFLKLEDTTFTSGDATSVISNGTITVNGTLSSSYNYITPKISNFIKAGNYVFSKNTEAHVLGVRLYNKDGTKNTYSVARGSLFKKITIKKDAEAYELYLGKPSTEEGEQAVDLQIKPQLEEGEIQTDFIPNETEKYIVPTQEPLYETDTFVKIGNVWYEKHNMGVYVFTGNENYLKSTYSDDTWFCGYIQLSVVSNIKIDGKMLATRFNNIGSYGDILEEECIRCSGQFQVRILASSLSENSADAYKNLLKQWYEEGNPLKAVYELKTPELIGCTPEQSAVLEELYNTEMYLPTTIITSDDEIQPINTLRYNYVIASPSMEIPSDVRGVGDNINILITENSSNYTINPDGTYNESPSRLCSDFIKVNSNKQDYILSANQSLGFVGIAFYDKDKNYVGREAKNSVKTLAITKPSNVIYLRVFFQGNLLSSQSWFDYGIKLEKGSTATTYSKPNQGNIRIKKNNKNLLNLLNQSLGSNTTAGQNKTSNSIELIAIGTWSNCSYTFQNFEKNTHYTISANFMETIMDKNIIGISVYGDKNGSWTILKGDNRETTKNKVEGRVITFNTGDYDKIHIRFWNNYSATAITRGNSLVKITNIQLEEGTLATGYVEYQSKEYIIPIQQPFYEGDTFVKISNIWYEKHIKGRKIFNGTENFNFIQDTIIQRVIYSDTTIAKIPRNYGVTTKCSHFDGVELKSTIAETGVGVCQYDNAQELMFLLKNQCPNIVDKASWVDWVTNQYNTGTPLCVVYELATPELIECTEEQNAILNKIYADNNYDDITIVYGENEIEPNLDVAAFKKVTDLFKERLLTGKITRAYLRVLANETEPEMIINERNYLKDVKFEELRYVPDEGIIGGTVAKRVTGNFNNVDENFSIQDREFELYMGVDMDDDALNTPSGINIYNNKAPNTKVFIDDLGKYVTVNDNSLFREQIIIPKSNKYIMTYNTKVSYPNVRFAYFNENGFISREISNINGYVFTVPEGCTKIDIRANSEESSSYFTDLMITGGEKIPEEYEEFIPNIDYIKLGTYIVKKPENNTVADNTSFEALDYMFKLNLPWDNEITFPCTIKALFDNLVAQSGLKTNITSFPNQDFVVEANPFDDGVTRREVLSAIAQMAFNWSRLDQEDVLRMDFEQTDEIQEVFDIDKYSNLDTQDIYGPVNVIVLRNSQVEGENVTVRDEESINAGKGKNKFDGITQNSYLNLDGGLSSSVPDWISSSNFMKVKPNTQYIISAKTTATRELYAEFAGNTRDTIIGQRREITPNTPFTTTSQTKYIKFSLNDINATDIMLCEGTDTEYEPFIPNGETELVIADNPFAFTEAKRAELIEAGRRLFGLTYTPMTMDMIGYLFLNCQDKIKAQALSGKEYETYLFNHTIEYNGTISDSMESPAKTKTVTKYQFTPDLIKQMRRTEIIVDKANENITLISENLSATNDKVAQLRIEKDKIEAEVNNINKEIEDANGNIVTLKSTTEKLTQTIEGLTNTLTNTGGINLIRNSVGVFDSEYWEGVVKHYTDTEIKNNTTSGHSILLQNATITQIVNLKNGFYNISFLYKKIKELAECKIKINDFEILLEELELTNYEKVIEVTDNAVKIEMISDTDDSCYVSDLLLIAGTSKQEWTQNINETASDTVKIGKGIEITSTTSRTKLIADSESVRINNTTNNETVAEFTSTGTTTKNLIVQETAQIAGLLIQKNGNQTWISSLL